MQFLKSVILGAFLLLISATAIAQGHRGERGGFNLEKMTEQIDLTPEQATQLQTIHTEQRAAFAKLADGLPEGERPKREQVKELMQESRERMMSVLSADQQEKLKAERLKQRAEGKHKSKMNDELRSDLRAYHSEIITPTFASLRTAFDKKLSAAERMQISTLRDAVRTEFGERGLKHFGDKRSAHSHEQGPHSKSPKDKEKHESRDERDEHHAKMRAFLQKHKSDVQAVRDIVREHENDLTAVRAELDAAKVQWKKDRDAIRAKHLTTDQLAQRKERDAKRADMRETRHPGNREEARGAAFSPSDRGAFTFLLMDPARMEPAGLEELASETLNVYPNPASDRTTLKFEVRTSGLVRIELLDASGKVLQTILKEEREANAYELSVTLPPAMGKTGLLRVTDAKGIRTVQVTRN